MKKLKIIFNGALGLVGFLLSPLSWWNDILINIPLAYGFAWVIGKGLSFYLTIGKSFFAILFALGYWLTNLLGFLLIHYSVTNLTEQKKFTFKDQALVSLIYTALIVILIYFDIISFLPGEWTLVPNFVR
jgi:hypothetical protein